MAVAEKPSAVQAGASSGTLPDFPQFAPGLIGVNGGQETNAAIQAWWNVAKYQLLQQNNNLQQTLHLVATSQGSTGDLQAQIDEEKTVRAAADIALATDISTVSATLTTSIGIVAASVTTEASARATADGHLEGKYTLTVVAGNVVTGMNITSSTGSGTDISSVIFQATDFKIYNGVSGVTMFNVSGSDVNLAGTLTVSTGGKVFIGTGTYNATNTPWYVDSTGKFSLGNQLTWDGTTLTVASGSLTSVDWNTQVTSRPTELTDGRIAVALSSAGLVISGAHPGINVTTGAAGLYLGADFMGYYNGATWRTYIDNAGNFYLGGTSGSLRFTSGVLSIVNGTAGGWAISPTTISSSGAVLDSSGSLLLGSSNDIVILSATDPTYRIWVGNVTSGSASFRVTKTGIMTATGGIFSGAITSTSGTIGGFSIGSNSLVAGAGSNLISITNGSSPFVQLGALSGQSALLNVGFMTLQNNFGNVSVLVGVGSNAGVIQLLNASNSVTIDLHANTGIVTATGFAGDGSSLTGINAANITSGTLDNARLPSAITVSTVHTTSGITVDGSALFNSGYFAIGSCVILGGLTVTAPISAGNGSAGAPGFHFAGSTVDGLFWNGSGDVRIATSGVARLVVRDTAVVIVGVDLKLGTSRAAGSPTPGGTIPILDSTGATVHLITT